MVIFYYCVYDIFSVLAGPLNACCPTVRILQVIIFILLTLLITLVGSNFFPEIIF